jgi:chemotaxis protein methyltransferase CheR
MVTFAALNLADDVYPSSTNNTDRMDVILCRNVLIYLSPEHVGRWVRKLGGSLAEGGWLLVGASETSHVPPGGLARIQLADAIVYRKPPFPTPSGIDALALAGPAIEPEPVLVINDTNSLSSAKAPFDPGRSAEVAEQLSTPPPPEQSLAESPGVLARAYANQGQLAEAQIWCEKAIAAAKTDPTLHYLRAAILQERGDFGEASASLRKVVYLQPELVMAHFALGNLARQRGGYTDAAKHFHNAMRLLRRYEAQDILPESDGITASRLGQIISSMADQETIRETPRETPQTRETP